MTDRDLMQQALEALSDYIPMYDKRMSTITALRERLAQPEQEPVAWRWRDVDGLETIQSVKPYHEAEPLYPAPPQRKPLSDEEIREIADKHLFYQPEGYEVSGVFALARAIEAKLKEKNT